MIDYIGNFRTLRHKSSNVFVRDLKGQNTSVAEYVSTFRSFNAKSSNLGEDEHFRPLVLLNAFSNNVAGLDRTRRHIVYSLLIGSAFLSPLTGFFMSNAYFLGQLFTHHKTQMAFKDAKRAIACFLIRLEERERLD